MRSKKQKVDAVLATRDFLIDVARRQNSSYRGVPNPLRSAARSLLQQFPTEEELRPVLEAGLKDAVPPPVPTRTMTDLVRRRYSRRTLELDGGGNPKHHDAV
ncbi:MAG: hypothetical protein VKO65_00530 [Cyanobacteriota bacterium]|nr:hypothetical protein [Cyanobacteriota bacterium]